MAQKGYMKTVEAIIAAAMIFVFSTILITNPLGISRKVDLSNLKAMSNDALRVADEAIYSGNRTYMGYYLNESMFPPANGDPMLKGLYDVIGQGLPSNVEYQLMIEGTNSLGQGATVTIGPAPQASNVVTASYLKTIGGFLSAAQFPPIGILAAVDDQIDVDFLCATSARAQELYPDIQISLDMMNEGGGTVYGCDGTTPLPNDNNFTDFNNKMTAVNFVYVFEDLQKNHMPPGQTWIEYFQDIQCRGSAAERQKGIIFGASTLQYIYDSKTGWNDVAGILAVNKNWRDHAYNTCNGITQTLIYRVPTTVTSSPPTSDHDTAFVKDFKIARYHFITRDFLKGDILRYNDLWKDANSNPIFRPTSRPAYWPSILSGEGGTCTGASPANSDDDFWCKGLYSTYVSYDVSLDTGQPEREVWYELATHNNIEGTWDPDHMLPLSPTPCTGYNFNENRAAILKQIMPNNATYCQGRDNRCGRYAMNLIRLGRAWKIYMLYYENWGQIKEPDEGGNGEIDTALAPSTDDAYDSNLPCQPSCTVGSNNIPPGSIIIQPGPDGILQSIPGGDDQEVKDASALEAAQDLTTLMFEEIVWASFWDTPYEYRIYKITLLTWYKGGEYEMLAEKKRWFYE